jgi:hypothetical protein
LPKLKDKRGRKKFSEAEIGKMLQGDIEELTMAYEHLQGKTETYIQRLGYFNKTRRHNSKESLKSAKLHAEGEIGKPVIIQDKKQGELKTRVGKETIIEPEETPEEFALRENRGFIHRLFRRH